MMTAKATCQVCKRTAPRAPDAIAHDMRQLADRQNNCILRRQAAQERRDTLFESLALANQDHAAATADAYVSLQPESLLRWALELQGRCAPCASTEAQRLMAEDEAAFRANRRPNPALAEVVREAKERANGKASLDGGRTP